MPATVPTKTAVNSDPGEAAVSTHAAVVLTMEKETPPEETAALRARLRDAQRNHAIQKANAEQARRSADCLRGFYGALLPLLAQPCLTLGRDDGEITFWNAALTDWTGIASADAVGQPLKALFSPDIADALNAAFLVARHRVEAEASCAAAPITGLFSPDGRFSHAAFTLLPLRRVPGCLESCLVLFDR